MKTCSVFSALLFLIQPIAGQGVGEIQTWTSRDGKTIQAKFIRTEDDAVVIEKDGNSFAIPFAKLAPGSVELAKKLHGNTGGAPTVGGAAMITNKLQQIIIPKIEFKGTPVKEAFNFLHQRSVELDTLEADSNRKGVKFVFRKSTTPDKAVDIDSLLVGGLNLAHIPLGDALKYICAATMLHYKIEDSQVTLTPLDDLKNDIETRTFTVPSNIYAVLAGSGKGGDSRQAPRKSILQLLKEVGIDFKEGTSATLSNNKLLVVNSITELDKIELILNSFAATAAADPTIRFRWLQTDLKTADTIIEAIKGNSVAADALGAKIDQQVKGGKITEVAAFNQKIVSGERFVLRPATGNIPLVVEAEATVAQDGTMDLRCVSEWTPKTPQGSGLLSINAATILSRQHWHLFGRWNDAKTDTLLLAFGDFKLVEPNPAAIAETRLARAAHPPVVIHLDAEWRETTADDLAKVAQAPPESRANALVWLRGRSKLLAGATGTAKSGQKSTIEYLWGGKTIAELKAEAAKRENQKPKEEPPRPGVTLEWEPNMTGSDKPLAGITPTTAIEEIEAKENRQILSQDLDLRLAATYVPLKPHGESPGSEFRFQGKLRPGVPELVAAKAAPQKDQPVVVLVLAPWYDIIR